MRRRRGRQLNHSQCKQEQEEYWVWMARQCSGHIDLIHFWLLIILIKVTIGTGLLRTRALACSLALLRGTQAATGAAAFSQCKGNMDCSEPDHQSSTWTMHHAFYWPQQHFELVSISIACLIREPNPCGLATKLNPSLWPLTGQQQHFRDVVPLES